MTWTTIKTVAYTGIYNGPNPTPRYDPRATGGVVLIQERTVKGKTQRRALTTNGKFSFSVKL